MEFNTAHDIIHENNGNQSELCPVCSGDMKAEEAIAKAGNIIKQQRVQRSNQSMHMFKEDGSTVDKKEGKEHLSNKTSNSALRMHKTTVFPLSKIVADEKGVLPKEIQIMPIGTWDTVPYGELQITASDLQEMKDNFEKGYRAGVPIDVDHDGKAAAGWIQSLRVADDGLWAQVEWTKLGKDLLDGKVYKFFSPEFNPEYTDPENKDVKLKNVLIAGSLVNRPLFKELKPVIASDHLTAEKSGVMLFIDMNLDDLKKKKAAGEKMSDAEDKFLKDNVKADDGNGDDDTKKVDDVSGKEKMTTISASEVKKLREDAELGRKAAEKLEAKEIDDTVKSWTFSENGGHFQPALKDPLVKFYSSLNSEQRKTFSELVEKMPEQKYFFDEKGSAEELTAGKVADTITLKANELMSEAKKEKRSLKFGEAVKQVLRENPEMAEYDLKAVPGRMMAK